MKQRYIDFVPAKGKKGAKKPVGEIKPTVKKKAPESWVDDGWVDEELAIEEMFAEKPDEPMEKLGVIEDFRPKFVKGTDVKKRPLGKKPTKIGVKSVAKPAAVSKSVAATKGTSAPKPAVKTTSKSAVKSGVASKGPRGPRTTAFVNVNKIEKRPLSRSGYANVRRPAPYKREEPKAPEKIIIKPEKDSNAGLIITIVVTIILGAAAGTVAFLLLPK